MSEPFLAEIKIFAGNFAPRGWALCDGQILPINQNQSLYSLLGTTYGGDGRTSFALPDLRGRLPMHYGNGYTLGSKGGSETVTLTPAEIPSHTHTIADVKLMAHDGAGTEADPGGRALAHSVNNTPYTNATPDAELASSITLTVGNTGGGQAHNNLHPYLCLNFIIALRGLFPSRS